MALWTWWPGDALPALPPIDDFRMDARVSAAELARLTGLADEEIAARLNAGNRCYVARLNDVPVAYGWVARANAAIGELGVTFRIDAPDRYLWDFVTLPAWRGRGIYPRLLQCILWAEGTAACRFWIINAPENVASAKGIAKAGFGIAGDLAFTRDGRAGIVPRGNPERARPAAALLGVPLVDAATSNGVSPCWCCIRDALSRGLREASCWPSGALAGVTCTCAAPANRLSCSA